MAKRSFAFLLKEKPERKTLEELISPELKISWYANLGWDMTALGVFDKLNKFSIEETLEKHTLIATDGPKYEFFSSYSTFERNESGDVFFESKCGRIGRDVSETEYGFRIQCTLKKVP